MPTEKEIKRKQKLTQALKLEEDKEEEEEEEEPMNDQNSDVQKVLQYVRDHIIKSTVGIREAFGLPEVYCDHYFEFYEFKRMLKDI